MEKFQHHSYKSFVARCASLGLAREFQLGDFALLHAENAQIVMSSDLRLIWPIARFGQIIWLPRLDQWVDLIYEDRKYLNSRGRPSKASILAIIASKNVGEPLEETATWVWAKSQMYWPG